MPLARAQGKIIWVGQVAKAGPESDNSKKRERVGSGAPASPDCRPRRITWNGLRLGRQR